MTLKQKLEEMQKEKEMSRAEITKALLKYFPDHLPIWGFLERTIKDVQDKERQKKRTNSNA